MTWRAVLAAAVALLAIGATPSLAEPVEIKLADGGRGQGWLFKDPGAGVCGVVTAAHVVAGIDRRDILVLGRDGAEAYVSAVRILSPPVTQDADGAVDGGGGIDAALLLVEGPLKAQGCSGSITGSTNLTLTLARTRVGELERFDAGEFPKQPVEFRVQGSVRPDILALKTRPQDPLVAPGYSGSTVVDAPEARTAPGAAPTPLAMVIQIGEAAADGQFLAVRYDALWRLVRSALGSDTVSPAAAAGAPGFSVSDWSGTTLDPQCPAPNMLAAATVCPWRTRPRPGARHLQFTLTALSGPTPIEAVDMEVEGYEPAPGRTVGLEVNPTGRPEDWAFVRRCEGRPGAVRCQFSQVIAQSFRLTFDALDARPLDVRVRSIVP